MDDISGDFAAGDAGHEEKVSTPTDRRAVVLSFLALGLIALFTVFALQNSDTVEVEALAWTFSMSKILLMLFSALVGIGGTLAIRFIRR